MENELSLRESIEAAMPEEEDVVETVVDNTPEPEQKEQTQSERPQLSTTETKPKAGAEVKQEAKPDDTPGIQPGPKSSPKTEGRAPASWHPETREHWGCAA